MKRLISRKVISLCFAVLSSTILVAEGLTAKADASDLLVRNSQGDMLLYPFKDGSFYSGGGPIKVGNGWSGFTNYFVGNWTGNNTPDLIVRNSQGDLLLYPFKNGSYYNGGGPIKVGNGWNGFTNYFVGNWTGNNTPDLIVRNSQGDMLLYPFKNGSFYNGGGPIKVGHGWTGITDYLVGNWTGNNTPDLIVRNSQGDLLLYPFKNGSFYNGGGPIKVGNGWNGFTNYFVGNWTGNNTPDLIVRNSQGDLLLYPFKNGSFYNGGGPIKVGNSWNGFTNYLVGNWTGNNTPDLIVRNSQGDLLLYPFKNGSFYNGGGPIKVGNGWSGITNYLVAN